VPSAKTILDNATVIASYLRGFSPPFRTVPIALRLLRRVAFYGFR
jgi:hypothetical protein